MLGRRVHLCLVQPPGYRFSLVLLDPVRHFKHHLQALGLEVSTSLNHLEPTAVNLVFGAHLLTSPDSLRGHRVVIVNLEQLGVDGAAAPHRYLQLLADNVVIDYHASNASSYRGEGEQVPLVSFTAAPWMGGRPVAPLAERPVDLLFLGTQSPRRTAVLAEARSRGLVLHAPQAPVFGRARDALVRQAKAVLNVGAYASPRFEQIRASVALSNGTPLVSERRGPLTGPDAAYEELVEWVDLQDAGQLAAVVRSEAFRTASARRLDLFGQLDDGPLFAAAWESICSELSSHPRPVVAPRDEAGVSLVVSCTPDVRVSGSALLELLAESGDAVEELVLCDAGDGVAQAVAAHVDGDVTYVWTAGLEEDEALEHAAWAARTSTAALLSAGRELDREKLAVLVAGQRGRADVSSATTRRPLSGAPLVSVVVRTFNRPVMLARCLRSLADQILRDFEVVVVNDCGQDVSPVVEGFVDELEIRLHTPDRPRGRAGALNDGLVLSRGVYACVVDDDDVVYPEHLLRLTGAADPSTAVYSASLKAVETADGVVVARSVEHHRAFDRAALLQDNYLPILSVLFPLTAARRVGLVDEELPVLEDWEFWIRLSASTEFRFLPVVSSEYRVRGDASNSTTGCADQWCGALRRIYSQHPTTSPDTQAARERLLSAWSAARSPFAVSWWLVDDLSSASALVEASSSFAPGTQVVAVLRRSPASERVAAAATGTPVTVVLVGDLEREEKESIAVGRCRGHHVEHLVQAPTGRGRALPTPRGSAARTLAQAAPLLR